MKKHKINWGPAVAGFMSTAFTIIFTKLGFNWIVTFVLVMVLILVFAALYKHFW